MNPIYIALPVQHYLFDWLFQTRWMANNKSKNWLALTVHCSVVSAGLALTMMMFNLPLIWFTVNAVMHFVIDGFTSRLTSIAWASKQEKLFFSLIGLDQLLHYVLLFGML